MSAILVHGGAGPHRTGRAAKRIACSAAADAGWAVLAAGGTALAAVEAATRALEDDPLFDAGLGSYLNRDGEIELDAILMDGRDITFGAVAAVQRVKNPITLARHVLAASPHAMLAGAGAERFARDLGLTVPGLDLIAPDILAGWLARRHGGELHDVEGDSGAGGDPVRGPDRDPDRDRGPDAGVGDDDGDLGDTVGAVAIDADGHVAAATSTGGTRDKWPGRVGDSPIVGSGAYADDLSGAVSCTGHGESIMRVCLAYAACGRMEAGDPALEACRHAVDILTVRTGGQVGLIAVDRHGRLGWAWNTAAMPYAWRDDGGAGAGAGS